MPLELKETYTLTDLLLMAGQAFTCRELRKISFVIHSELTYFIEHTDARTNQLRYGHVNSGKTTILAYFEMVKQDEALREFYRDLRTCMSRQSISSKMQAEIYLPTMIKPVIYQATAGGYGYKKLV